jgi:4-hydroxybenzoate polyprenyltransferase
VKKAIALLRLTRPANIVTAIADILAGVAISGYFLNAEQPVSRVLLLIGSTIGLYGGGVVLNDVFDADLDRLERPERPIPSGTVTIAEAAFLGSVLLLGGIAAAALFQSLSAWLAVAISCSAVIYDKWGKHHSVLGPLNMGLCRGLNLLLGISAVQAMVSEYWYLSFFPIIYIAAVTMISRGEVHGGKKTTLNAAGFLYFVVAAAIAAIAWHNSTLMHAIPFVLCWLVMILVPLAKAVKTPEGRLIGKAVKAGVIALILMNAGWAAAFGAWQIAVFICALLPISILLARAFAVT